MQKSTFGLTFAHPDLNWLSIKDNSQQKALIVFMKIVWRMNNKDQCFLVVVMKTTIVVMKINHCAYFTNSQYGMYVCIYVCIFMPQ